MEPFIQRIIEEKAELDNRLVKLTSFIDGDKFKSVDPTQQSLLKIQAMVMDTYSTILQERLDRLV